MFLIAILTVSRMDRVRNEEMRRRAGIEMELASRADQRVLRWFGHVEKMDDYRMVRRVLMAEVSGGRVRGRPRLGWMDGVKVSYAKATLDKKSCVITSTLFEMNSTCMRLCDLNFSCLSTSITSAEVSSCQDKRRYPNPIWPTVFTFRVFKHSFCEFMTMVSLHVHKST